MALFFCGICRISFLWTLLLFITWAVVSSASNAPSRSGYMTKQRRQRVSDAWITLALNNICPWAECNGWIGCRKISNPPNRCSPTPANFRELEVRGPRPHRFGACYGYSPPGDPAPDDWCKYGPKRDECACIESNHVLRIGYSEKGKTKPYDDAPIRDLCASRITSSCTNSAETPSELVTSFVISTDAPSTTSSASVAANPIAAPTIPQLVSTTTTYVQPTNEGSTSFDHWYIWLPLVVAVALASCLLVALCRRRSKLKKTLAEVTSGGGNNVEMDEDGYLAVSRIERKVSTTHDNYNAQSDKSVAVYEELKINNEGSAEPLPYQELKIGEGGFAEPLPYQELKIGEGGSAELLRDEELKASDGRSVKHQQAQHPLCELIRSYDHAEPYAQVECSRLT